MPLAELNGQGIYFEDSGGSGPAVILGHGFLMDGRMFDAQVQALAPEFRVIRWDARGFGRTRWDGEPFTLWDSAADCVALLDYLGIRQAVIGGMSQGGYCALRVALRYPERVRALVLMSTRGTLDEQDIRAGYQQVRELWGHPGAQENIIQNLAQAILGDSRFHAPWLERWRQVPAGHFAAAMNNLLHREDIHERLASIPFPAIVFHGLEDTGIPPSEGERLHRTLPGSKRFVPVPGAAHAANLTHPEVVNPPLLEFLRAHG
jgi:3-oxoadipate enol-lactonase